MELAPIWKQIDPIAQNGSPERFEGPPAHSLMRLLVFLSPVTLRGGRPSVVEVFEAR